MTHSNQKRLSALISVLTLVFCLLTVLPASAFADIEIATAADLIALSQRDFSEIQNETILLTADIDMTGQKALTPIGGSSPFSGTFDGQGHIIKNLTIKAQGYCSGLFGHVGTQGSITRLGLENISVNYSITSDNTAINTGAFAGVLSGSVTECFVTGSITGMRYTGGIAGMLHAGTIENCMVDVTFTGSRYCGGLFGGTEYMTEYADSDFSASAYSKPLDAAITGKAMVIRNNLTLGSISANRYPAGIMGEMDYENSSPLSVFEGNVSWLDSVTAKAADSGKTWFGPVYANWDSRQTPQSGKGNLYHEGMSLKGNATGNVSSTDISLYDSLNIRSASSADLGSQAAYEALGWDFTDTWTWNDELGHPVLRNIMPAVNEARTIYIDNEADFLALYRESFTELSNDNIYLTADLDMSGYTVAALGGASAFNGLFDGQDHTIYNLTIRNSGICTGLFGYVGVEGKIKNLGLENANITGTSPGTNTGAFAGVLTGSVTECFVTGKIAGQRYTGGVAGLLHAGTIENCWTDIAFTGSRNCGGLFGGSDYDTDYTSGYSPLSGVIAGKGMVIRNNLTLGTVSANRRSGGILGDMGNTKSSALDAFEGNVAWTSSVSNLASGNEAKYYGPVFAWWSKDRTNPAIHHQNLYWADMKVTGVDECQTPSECQTFDTLNIHAATAEALGMQKTYEDIGWDFDSVWVWSEKLGHPVLRGQNEPAIPGEQKTPASLVTTFAGDAKTTRAFTWYTDTTVTGSVVQAVPADSYTDETSFSSGAVLSKTGTAYTLQTAADGTSRIIHQVNLTGLSAGTAYYYRAGDGTNWSNVYTFTTEPEEADSFTFLSMTDTQNQYARYLDALNQASAAYPDSAFIVHSGDVIQNNITGDYDEIFKITQSYAATLPTMVSPGNHELAKDDKTNDGEAVNYVKGLANFKSHYLYPDNGPAGSKQVVYSFDYGDAHFACLNSNVSSYTEQIAWLKADLAATDKAWKIVSIHHGPYNSGEKGNSSMRQAMQDLEVDLILFGHNHIFLRSNPITDGVQETITPVNGVYYAEAGSPSYYSSGCAGGSAGSIGSSNYFVIHKNPSGGSVYGAITVTEDTLTVRSHAVTSSAARSAAQPFDTYVITKPKSTGSADGVSLTYNGMPQKLIGSALADGGDMLYSLDGVNFSAAVPTAVDAGDYTIYCKVKGGAQHSDSEVFTVESTIAPLDISGAKTDIVLGEIPVYTGSEVEQSVESVTANGLPVTCSVSGNTGKAVGDYTLTITGTGNFTGSITAAWRIAPAPDLPQTGDSSILPMWAMLAAAALLGLSALNRKTRKA